MSDLNLKGRRKRRPEAKNFTLRLTEDEKRLLLARAGRTPLSAFIRGLVLGGDDQPRQRRGGKPRKDDTALARVLALLGQSRLSSNLNQLAKAVNIGALPVTPETESEIASACVAVIAMRHDLLAALGLGEGSGP